MNANQAKAIRLEELMDLLGHKPMGRHRGGTEIFYSSPFRDEKDASLSVNLRKNVYFDFGDNLGGNTLDFTIRLLVSRGVSSSVSDALKFLDGFFGKGRPPCLPKVPASSFSQQRSSTDTSLEFISAAPLEHRGMLSYISNKRFICEEVAKAHLVQIKYKNNDKEYSAISMPNMSPNGYEIRSYSDVHVFKSAFNRDLSLIEGGMNTGRVDVYEGMFDALSGIEMGKGRHVSDALVLHSLSGINRAIEFIKDIGYQDIRLFLDNDGSGQKATCQIQDEFENTVVDESRRYVNFKDVNQAAQSGVNIFTV